MANSAYPAPHEMGVGRERGGRQDTLHRVEDLSSDHSRADWRAGVLLDSFNPCQQVFEFGVWLPNNAHTAEITDISLVEKKISSAPSRSARETGRISCGMPRSSQSSNTESRVIPSSAPRGGLRTTPSVTAKTLKPGHGRRNHACQPIGRSHPRQRPARTPLVQPPSRLLGKAPPGLARDADRLRSAGRRRGRRPADPLIEIALKRPQIGSTKISRGRHIPGLDGEQQFVLDVEDEGQKLLVARHRRAQRVGEKGRIV
jgi:hypothetical protein